MLQRVSYFSFTLAFGNRLGFNTSYGGLDPTDPRAARRVLVESRGAHR
jgi:hypothetical protein